MIRCEDCQRGNLLLHFQIFWPAFMVWQGGDILRMLEVPGLEVNRIYLYSIVCMDCEDTIKFGSPGNPGKYVGSWDKEKLIDDDLISAAEDALTRKEEKQPDYFLSREDIALIRKIARQRRGLFDDQVDDLGGICGECGSKSLILCTNFSMHKFVGVNQVVESWVPEELKGGCGVHLTHILCENCDNEIRIIDSPNNPGLYLANPLSFDTELTLYTLEEKIEKSLQDKGCTRFRVKKRRKPKPLFITWVEEVIKEAKKTKIEPAEKEELDEILSTWAQVQAQTEEVERIYQLLF